ncbi:VOC family protein [Falsibacillus albus]|uniref:VOC family protein n=1 Tax=Falsibacillus albus TaxID=2478915 RepID=A0A3L7JR95_9BACI|nr:VOC family protein [Falsibacillus albus]RLQ93186.1 VOC family protein [Falsibacillus albus]
MDMKLGYVILYVENLEKSVYFYRDLLGLPLKMQAGTYTEFDTGGTTLSLNTRESIKDITGFDLPDGKVPQTLEIGFVTEDVKGTVERLRAEGTTILSEATEKPWGQLVAYVEDPDGHYIEICSPM